MAADSCDYCHQECGTEACYGLKYSAALAVDNKIKGRRRKCAYFRCSSRRSSPEPGPTTDEIPPGRTTFFRYYVEDLKPKRTWMPRWPHKLLYLSLGSEIWRQAGKWETGFAGLCALTEIPIVLCQIIITKHIPEETLAAGGRARKPKNTSWVAYAFRRKRGGFPAFRYFRRLTSRTCWQ